MTLFSRTAVIIPAYNEEKHIRQVIRNLKKYTKNIIVIDDGSTDNTLNELKREGITLLKHVVNLGKGAALTTGVKYAQKLGFKKVILMDSDGQHDPDDLIRFAKNLAEYDLIIGVRKLEIKTNVLRCLGNKFDSYLIELLFGKRLQDPICGYRAFNMKIYPKIKWESNGYGVETEIIIRAILKRVKLVEIPVSSIYLDKYKGVSILDAYKIFFDVIKWRLTL